MTDSLFLVAGDHNVYATKIYFKVFGFYLARDRMFRFSLEKNININEISKMIPKGYVVKKFIQVR